MVERVAIDKLFCLDNKVVLITGAGQNIGQGFAYALGCYGAKIAVVDYDKIKAEQTVAMLLEHDIEAIAITADVTIPAQVDNMLKEIIERWQKLDIAINNVGICYGDAAETMNLADWDIIINTNLRATFYSCQQQCKLMQQQTYGKIINTASVAGVLISHPQKISAYNTAKGAIIHMTRSLAAEWICYGIRVNCISPGVIHVPAFDTPEMQNWVINWQQQIPAQRLAQVDDLLGAAVFLASPASDYMVGQNLIIDGGHTLW